MKQFLCLKDLVMDDGERSLTAGKLYHSCDKEFTGVWNDDGRPHYGIILYGSWVETFGKGGHTWIRHSGGDCPVPDSWFVEVMVDTDTGSDKASNFFWGDCSHRIGAWRIISTVEPEQVVRGDVLHFTQQGFKRHQDHVLGGLEDMLQKEKDSRPLSPQETAYAAKMAEKDEDESGAGGGKTFPSSALRDMSDKTFANLLGMGQFIGGEE